MGTIKNLNDDGQYEELEFDDTLWEIMDIPEEVYRSWYELDEHPNAPYLTQTLHYVGPVVGGEILCEIPHMNFWYHTFANCKELKEIPQKFNPIEFWEPFFGCCNLNPSIEKVQVIQKRVMFCSGKCHGRLLDHCGSPHILMVDTLDEFFAKLTGYNLPQFSKLRDMAASWFQVEDLTKIITSILQQGLPLKATTRITNSAGIIEIKHISKTSEIPAFCYYKVSITSDFIIACSCSGADMVTDSVEVFVGVFADNFVNDTMDADILSVRPQAISGNIKGSITVTNSEVLFDGDCTMEAEQCPVIVAEGILTLKGCGNILLKSSGMQPVIGIVTTTGMSYGRWCPGYGKLEKIVIDGVQVKLEGEVSNFTIGSYGKGYVPEIELINGGTLDCPETKGKRVMKQSGAEDLYGSTKRSKLAIYEIGEQESIELGEREKSSGLKDLSCF